MEKSISDVIVLKRYSHSKIYSKPIALPLSNLIASRYGLWNLICFGSFVHIVVETFRGKKLALSYFHGR